VLYSHIGNGYLEGSDEDDQFYGSAGKDVYLGGKGAVAGNDRGEQHAPAVLGNEADYNHAHFPLIGLP
jgi:Ca2+-binding RTX toxin-like protein